MSNEASNDENIMKIYLWNVVALEMQTDTKDFFSTTASNAFASSGIYLARSADHVRGKVLRETEEEHPNAKIKIDVRELSENAKDELKRWLNINHK
jgi:hypothetical protein